MMLMLMQLSFIDIWKPIEETNNCPAWWSWNFTVHCTVMAQHTFHEHLKSMEHLFTYIAVICESSAHISLLYQKILRRGHISIKNISIY